MCHAVLRLKKFNVIRMYRIRFLFFIGRHTGVQEQYKLLSICKLIHSILSQFIVNICYLHEYQVKFTFFVMP